MNAKGNILVVDDEPDIRKLIHIILEKNGYIVDEAEDGETAVQKVSENKTFDLIVIDIMMPRLSGTEACKRIRQFSTAPILFLTAKTKEPDKDEAYASGGDDFLGKPFNQADLLRKVSSLIRRYCIYKGKENPQGDHQNLISIDNIQVDFAHRCVYKDNEPVRLTDKEYDLLTFLLKNRGVSWRMEDLYEKVWQDKCLPTSSNTIMVHILRLRQKLEADPSQPQLIRTIYGKGYQID